MMGFGILALVGLGLAMSAGGGGGDDVEVDEAEDIVEPDEDMVEAPEIDLGDITDEEELEAEIQARIEAFVAELEADPDLTPEEATERLNAFIAELEAELEGDEPVETPAEPSQPAEPEEEEAVVRPPTGPEFNDPTLTPREPFVPSTPTPAEPSSPGDSGDPAAPITGASAEQLVNVVSPGGLVYDDSTVISEGPDGGPNADRDFIVETRIQPNNIQVGYDALSTFLIKYSGATGNVVASLNSDIEGPSGAISTAVSTETDENGTEYSQWLSTRTYDDNAEIEMRVSAEQIGAHVSEIDLQNPNDVLRFEFSDDVTGNLHLVYSEVEADSVVDSLTTRTAYVIETPASVTSLSQSDVARIVADNGTAPPATRLVAAINLGFESIDLEGSTSNGETYRLTVADFINETPQISTNIDWTSVTEADGTNIQGPGGGTPREPEDDFGLDIPFFNPLVLGF